MKHFIITPVGNNCNLHCDYCYHSNLKRDTLGIMKKEVLEKFIKESLSLFDSVRYTWHGGEPTLAGVAFFQEIVALQKKYKKSNQQIINGIQTNATLIDESWGEFFAKNDFYASTTLDGEKIFHNLHRDNSFEKVINGINILKKYLPRVGIIIVISYDNVKYPEEMYNFFCKQQWFSGFELHPCMPTAENNNLVPNENDLLNFLCRIFDLWWERDNPKIIMRSFRDIIRVVIGEHPKTCISQRKGCMHIASINYDGNVYTCSRFMQEKEGFLGNILLNDLPKILHSENAENIYTKMISLPQECLECKWLDYCGGGCAYQRWLDGWSKYYQCNVRRKFFEYVVPKIKKSM